MEMVLQLFGQVLKAAARLLVEMAPYLWLGLIASFLVKLWVPAHAIRRMLGGTGWRPVFVATLAGIPLPLCSCGVLPLAAALRREGCSRGSVSAFTLSTPQTGLDSIFATAGLLGWPMAVVRVITALVSGVLAGLAVDWGERRGWLRGGLVAESASKKSSCCCHSENSACRSGKPGADGGESQFGPKERPSHHVWKESAVFAFWRLPGDIAPALLVGTLLAAAVVALVPEGFGSRLPGGTLAAYAMVTALAVPVYVCSTGVIPLAFGLLAMGFPPGAAIILLVAGPSVSAASLITLARLVGWPAVVLGSVVLLIVVWSVAAGVPLLVSPETLDQACHSALHSLPSWRIAATVGLMALLLASLLSPFLRKFARP